MNKIIRISALCAALFVTGAVITGCGGSAKYDEQFAVIVKSCEKALAVVKAEIEVNENITVDEEIEGVVKNGSSYTYIQYDLGESPAYSVKTTDGTSEYALFKDERGTFEVKGDNLTVYTGEDPDFKKYIELNFAVEDIKKIEVAFGDKGTKLYTVSMKSSYADKFDADTDAGKYDCTAVQYIYKIDSLSRLKSVETKYTAKQSYSGKTVNTVRTQTVGFAEMAVQ